MGHNWKPLKAIAIVKDMLPRVKSVPILCLHCISKQIYLICPSLYALNSLLFKSWWSPEHELSKQKIASLVDLFNHMVIIILYNLLSLQAESRREN